MCVREKRAFEARIKALEWKLVGCLRNKGKAAVAAVE